MLGDSANGPFPLVAKAWDAPDLSDEFRVGRIASRVRNDFDPARLEFSVPWFEILTGVCALPITAYTGTWICVRPARIAFR